MRRLPLRRLALHRPLLGGRLALDRPLLGNGLLRRLPLGGRLALHRPLLGGRLLFHRTLLGDDFLRRLLHRCRLLSLSLRTARCRSLGGHKSPQLISVAHQNRRQIHQMHRQCKMK